MINSNRKAKLIWGCRRGMLELDLILQRFTTQYLENLTESELVSFETLLRQADPDLYSWLMGYERPEQKEFDHIIALIQLHSRIQGIG